MTIEKYKQLHERGEEFTVEIGIDYLAGTAFKAGEWVRVKPTKGTYLVKTLGNIMFHFAEGDAKHLTLIEDEQKPLENSSQKHHVGSSNYSEFSIQPWDIWEEYDLNPFDADIVKRVLRTKKVNGMTPEESRIEDYEKIIHICQYRIEKLKEEK